VEVAVPPALDQARGVTISDTPESGTPDTGRPGSAPFRTVLAGVLVLVLLASLGSLIWLLAGRRGDAEDFQREREAAMAQAGQFMLRMGTYGPDLLDDRGAMPEYRSRVKELITPKFATSFDQEAGTAEQLVAQAGVARDAEVHATGISTIDGDSATALVAGTFTDSYAKGGQAAPAPFRIEVTLVKTHGEWLVDNFSPVTAE
jgi:Mce-associated membrane protein